MFVSDEGPPTTGPAYQRIKDWVRGQIQAGRWTAGDPLPTEAQLAAQFGVSRMTANRAMRELRDDGVVVRIQGSGSFVAPNKYKSTVLSIESIDHEIQARGHTHHVQLQQLERCLATEQQALVFDVPTGAPLFHSVMLHFDNNEPIQVEDRYVSPAAAPGYMSVNWAQETPSSYLLREVPLESVQFTIEACAAPEEIAHLLAMATGDPALVLHRRTTSRGCLASTVAMWHPASRYSFSGSF